ncbi:MAG: non-canonical purine NTP pyrophosphatase, partial [Aliifodinibius sp.]|nr:non-canonical purine NTP pyrophosphatase [candidate division Zixibacteria bacterium]NIT59305.1 non-canonical purine NTP pyrophosphatase [Fodinibius sp.]NIW46827.1 non-canonical purine NTP pyrophosphatase [Gammaproteobacteria bacterium]NIS47411.1 non-canonical purine NTP pyrophosphatase [candidate division Zixibacteria bacterium]NIU15509.1 non-canonical purine NTP pyrophosphatase [candidate division Zixibacteria bacterium]
MPTLLLASGNLGKLEEFKALLAGIPVELVTPQALDLHPRVTEDGHTYAENASKKALAYAQAAGLPALADDTGLEVDVLNGEPGLFSARYAPKKGASDADRRQFLLERLSEHPRPWVARFRCVVAIALDDERAHLTEGVCTGEIIPEERGEHGFGYDRIFYFPDLGKTMA